MVLSDNFRTFQLQGGGGGPAQILEKVLSTGTLWSKCTRGGGGVWGGGGNVRGEQGWEEESEREGGRGTGF